MSALVKQEELSGVKLSIHEKEALIGLHAFTGKRLRFVFLW